MKQRQLVRTTKTELRKLIGLCEKYNQIRPLIYDEENVVEHLQRIEEFFEDLIDSPHDIKTYMEALLESIHENEDSEENIGQISTQLSKLITTLIDLE